MGDLINYSYSFPAWKAILWCFYPICTLLLIDLVTNSFNDDDDDGGGGQMMPAYQKVQ